MTLLNSIHKAIRREQEKEGQEPRKPILADGPQPAHRGLGRVERRRRGRISEKEGVISYTKKRRTK